MIHAFKINGSLTKISAELVTQLFVLSTVKDKEGTRPHRVAAIKYARDQLQLGLKEAKDLCDFISAYGRMDVDGIVYITKPSITVEYEGVSIRRATGSSLRFLDESLPGMAGTPGY